MFVVWQINYLFLSFFFYYYFPLSLEYDSKEVADRFLLPYSNSTIIVPCPHFFYIWQQPLPSLPDCRGILGFPVITVTKQFSTLPFFASRIK